MNQSFIKVYIRHVWHFMVSTYKELNFLGCCYVLDKNRYIP